MKMSLSLRIKDLKKTKLFLWRLNELRAKMTIAGSPFASELDSIIDRYLAGGNDEGAENGP